MLFRLFSRFDCLNKKLNQANVSTKTEKSNFSKRLLKLHLSVILCRFLGDMNC